MIRRRKYMQIETAVNGSKTTEQLQLFKKGQRRVWWRKKKGFEGGSVGQSQTNLVND